MVDSVIVLNDEHCNGNQPHETLYWRLKHFKSLRVQARARAAHRKRFFKKWYQFNLQNIKT